MTLHSSSNAPSITANTFLFPPPPKAPKNPSGGCVPGAAEENAKSLTDLDSPDPLTHSRSTYLRKIFGFFAVPWSTSSRRAVSHGASSMPSGPFGDFLRRSLEGNLIACARSSARRRWASVGWRYNDFPSFRYAYHRCCTRHCCVKLTE
jgi:hypothetical protein